MKFKLKLFMVVCSVAICVGCQHTRSSVGLEYRKPLFINTVVEKGNSVESDKDTASVGFERSLNSKEEARTILRADLPFLRSLSPLGDHFHGTFRVVQGTTRLLLNEHHPEINSDEIVCWDYAQQQEVWRIRPGRG